MLKFGINVNSLRLVNVVRDKVCKYLISDHQIPVLFWVKGKRTLAYALFTGDKSDKYHSRLKCKGDFIISLILPRCRIKIVRNTLIRILISLVRALRARAHGWRGPGSRAPTNTRTELVYVGNIRILQLKYPPEWLGYLWPQNCLFSVTSGQNSGHKWTHAGSAFLLEVWLGICRNI